jgi:hypothetical protein
MLCGQTAWSLVSQRHKSMGFTSVRFTDVSPQRYVDVSMQTDDPNSMLTKIDPDVLMEDRKVLDHEVNIKKGRECSHHGCSVQV